MTEKKKIGFLGYGNMAKALIHGITKKLLKKEDIIVFSPSISIKNEVDGMKVAKSVVDLVDSCEYLVLAVKPQTFKNEISDKLDNFHGKVVISIMAGITSAFIKKQFNDNDIKICRVMPNTPCLIGEGMVVIQKTTLDKEEKNFIGNLFRSVGKIMYLPEDKFDVATSVSGSGPAYVEYFLQAVVLGGLDGGLPYKQARELAIQTFLGTTKLVKKSSDQYLDELINQVCSKGGTTIEAINVLDGKDTTITIRKAMKACLEKSEELGKF